MTLVVTWDLTQKNQELRFETTHSLPEMPFFKNGYIVILTGDAPVWDYGIALRMLKDEAMSVVAMYDANLNGAVVVRSYSPDYVTSNIIPGHINGSVFLLVVSYGARFLVELSLFIRYFH